MKNMSMYLFLKIVNSLEFRTGLVTFIFAVLGFWYVASTVLNTCKTF